MRNFVLINLAIIFILTQQLAWAQESPDGKNQETRVENDNEPSIIFNRRDAKNNLDMNALISSGVISTLLGSSLLLFYVLSTASLNIENNWNELISFSPLQQNDFLLYSSIFFTSIGSSAIFIGTSLDLMDGTETDRKKWKKFQLITGITSFLAGGIMLGTGMVLRSQETSTSTYSVDSELPNSIYIYTGASLILFSLPSISFGIFY